MIKFASKSDRDGRFYNVFPTVLQVKMCGYDEDEIWVVTFEEDTAGDYWSFQYTDKDDFHLIFPHQILFNMCFAYGVAAEVKAGKGRIVHLKVVTEVPLSLIQRETNNV